MENRTPSRRTFVAGSIAAGAAAAALPRGARGAGPPVIRLGYVDSLSGPFAVGGIPQLSGARLAIADANRRGRARYELIVADDATKPAVGATEARRLVESEKVDVLLGGASSAVGNAVSAYAQNAGVLYVAVGTHDTAMTGAKANRVCFRQTCSLAMLANALGTELARRAKRWYFLVADYAFGTDARDRLKTILDAHGGTVAGMDLHPLGASDFSSFMVKARATDADAFLLLNGGTDTQNAATAFVQFGLNKRMLAAGVTGENELAAGFPSEELAGSLWGYVWGPDAGGNAATLHRRLAGVAQGFPPKLASVSRLHGGVEHRRAHRGERNDRYRDARARVREPSLRCGKIAARRLSRVRSPSRAANVLCRDVAAREAPRPQRVLPHRFGAGR